MEKKQVTSCFLVITICMLVAAVPPLKPKAQKATTSFVPTDETDIYITSASNMPASINPASLITLSPTVKIDNTTPGKTVKVTVVKQTTVQPSKLPATGQPSKLLATGQPSKLPATGQPSKLPASVHPSKLPATVQPSNVPVSIQPSKLPVQPSKLPASVQPSKLPASVQPSKSPASVQTSDATGQPSKSLVTIRPTLAPTTEKPIEDYLLSGTILCEQPNNAWLDVDSQVEVVGKDGSVYVKNQTNTYGQFRLRFNQKQLHDKNPSIVLRVQGNQCSGKKLEVKAAVDLSGKQLEYKFGPLLLRSQ